MDGLADTGTALAGIADASPLDALEVLRLHRRCRPETLASRYGAALAEPTPRELDALLRTDVCVVARAGDGEVVGLANASAFGEAGGGDGGVERVRTAELGVLVEDAWQGLGLGGALVAAVVERCRALGVASLVALTTESTAPLVAALRHHGAVAVRELEPGLDEIRCSLAPVPAPRAP